MELAVSDTGIGISDEHKARIFEPFFTTKQANQGTGLGLSIVREIVNNHNGLIQVESSLSGGTVFTVYWPVRVVPKVGQVDTLQSANN